MMKYLILIPIVTISLIFASEWGIISGKWATCLSVVGLAVAIHKIDSDPA